MQRGFEIYSMTLLERELLGFFYEILEVLEVMCGFRVPTNEFIQVTRSFLIFSSWIGGRRKPVMVGQQTKPLGQDGGTYERKCGRKFFKKI